MRKLIRIIQLIKAELFGKHCKVCGRLLTSEASRKSGIGPECLRKSPAKQVELLEREGQMRFSEGDDNGNRTDG